ncbi:short-chain dehydrogenase [Streptomyces sp. NPDC101151]|uniref:short-chain dehydrogenase n=1 Tax=Streptomyces sp. NPDC101151 TaxID=3366115 RepID=UPI00380C9F0E
MWAGSRTGKHIARLPAAEGFTVHVGSRDAWRGEAPATETGAGARPLGLDVMDAEGIDRAAARIDHLDVQRLPAPLRRSDRPRVVNVSSGTASLTRSSRPNPRFTPGSGGPQAEEGFKVNALAPGLRAADLNPRATACGGDPAEAVEAALRLALLSDDGPTGGFFSWDGTPVPW